MPISIVEPWDVDLDRFIGSNEEFGLTHLPAIRSAFSACNCDKVEITEVVRKLAADSLLQEVIAHWREAAIYFAEVTTALETAIERVADVARETETQQRLDMAPRRLDSGDGPKPH
jgi:hypothetical protein